jgi:large subunit ribosomal protein L32
MGVPKRKMSKMRLRTRKAANRFHAAKLSKCGQCGSSIPSHRACPSCGYYKGRQVLTIEAL